MGIRGLYSFLQKAATKTLEKNELSKWKGKRLGIDILCLLYRSRSAGIPLLQNISSFLAECCYLNIELIVVFDGSPPPQKKYVTAFRKQQREKSDQYCNALEVALERHDLTEEMKNQIQKQIISSRKAVPQIRSDDRDLVKQLFYATGTPFVHSIGEADNLLAYMSLRGEIDAVISTDYDFLARGVRHLIVPENDDLRISRYLHYDLTAICSSLELTPVQFREFACLLGTDYAPGLYSAGNGGTFVNARFLYKKYKNAGSLSVLLARYGLTQEKCRKIEISLEELSIERKTVDDFIKPDQKAKLERPHIIENNWIQERLKTGELAKETTIFLIACN